ncbi:hypothetical protein LINPERPRIM_LOCUS23848, partial [Linum perenne]
WICCRRHNDGCGLPRSLPRLVRSRQRDSGDVRPLFRFQLSISQIVSSLVAIIRWRYESTPSSLGSIIGRLESVSTPLPESGNHRRILGSFGRRR